MPSPFYVTSRGASRSSSPKAIVTLSTVSVYAASRLPLPALLSQVLVAFTIEFDNEFERQMPHRTTNHDAEADTRQSPWLVSMVMWWNCMRFVDEKGISVAQLESLARTKTNLHGMQRWGYIIVGPADGPRTPARSEWMIRATRNGASAREIWGPLFDAIEKRWQSRFGEDRVDRLRASLQALAARLDIGLPDCLPILGYGLVSQVPKVRGRQVPETNALAEPAMPALLSKVLLAFALRYERQSDVSLAIGANVLRLVDEPGVLVRDLPRLAALSKEGIATALSFLARRGYALVETESASRLKRVVLTSSGRRARDQYDELVTSTERSWQENLGDARISALRASLEDLVGNPVAGPSALLGGLEPYPDGWRASAPRQQHLPYYPMVSHRGGFPDGA